MGKIGEAGFVLTLREFAFLAALTGAESLYGIEDDTYKLSGEEIEQEWDRIKEQLENKNYIEIEIDGSITIDNDLFEMIVHCCQPKIVIKCNGKGISEKSFSRNFYVTKEIAIELDEDRLMKNTYALTPMSTIKKMTHNLKECYQIEMEYEKKDISFSLSFAEFEELTALIEASQEEDVINILTSLGCTGQIASDFYKALKEKKKYILTTLLKVNKNEIAEMSTFSIFAGEEYLFITSKITSNEDSISFSIGDADKIMKEVEYLAEASERIHL